MNVTVEKVKVVKAPETVKPDTKEEAKPEVALTVDGFQPVEIKTEKTTILERLEGALRNLMGSYDGKYQEAEKAEEAPEGGEKPEGEKLEGSYDGGYAECPHCGQKMKAEKKAEEPEPKPEKEEPKKEEPKKEEKSAEEVLPTKAEVAAEKPDLSVEAWRSNFYTNSGIKPSARNVDWMKACDAFTNPPSKQ